MSRQSRVLARHQQLVQLRHHRPRTQQLAERRVWLPLQLQQDGGQAAGAPFFHSCLLSLSQAASHSQNPVLSLQLPALLSSHWRTALRALRPIWFKTKEIKNQVTEGYLHQEQTVRVVWVWLLVEISGRIYLHSLVWSSSVWQKRVWLHGCYFPLFHNCWPLHKNCAYEGSIHNIFHDINDIMQK